MSLTPFLQWRFPKVACHDVDGHLVSLRINKGTLGYAGPTDPTKIVTLDALYQGAIFDIGELELAKHDVDGDPVVPKLVIKLSDFFQFSGVSNGSPVSYNLGASLSSLLEEIFTPDDGSIIYELWLDQYDNTGTLTEVWFVGDIDPQTIPKKYVYFHNEFTNSAQRIAEYDLTANFAAERLVSHVVNGTQLGTIQDFLAYAEPLGIIYSEQGVSSVAIGTVLAIDNGNQTRGAHTPPPSSHGSASGSVWLTCAEYHWTNSETHPNGVNVSSLDKLVKAVAQFANFDSATSGIDYDAPLELYKQSFVNDNGSLHWRGSTDCKWPLANVSPSSWDDIYVVTNFLFGYSIPKSTETVDGIPQNRWPITIPPDSSALTLIRWLCNATITYCAYAIAIDGTVSMRLRPRRPSSPVDFVTNFPYLAANIVQSGESPKKVSQSSLICQMNGDSLKLMCGPNQNDAVTVTMPWRCHKYGTPVGHLGVRFPIAPGSSTSDSPIENALCGIDRQSSLPLWFDKGLDPNKQGLTVTCEKKLNDDYWGGSGGDILTVAVLPGQTGTWSVGETGNISQGGGSNGTVVVTAINGGGGIVTCNVSNSGNGYSNGSAVILKSDGTSHNDCSLTVGDGQPTDRGWVGGSYLLWKNTDNSYQVFPTNEYDSPYYNTGSNLGYYAVAAIAPPGITLPSNDENILGYFNPTNAYAQIYFQEVVQNRIILVQKFQGCRDVNGKIQTLAPGLQMSTYIRGAVRDFQAHEVKISVMANTAEITWVEILDYTTTLPTVQTIAESGSQTQTSSSSATNTSPSGTVTGSFVKEYPATAADNVIAPASPSIPALYPQGAVIYSETVVTAAGVYAMSQGDLNVRLSGASPTGVTLPTAIAPGQMIFILNDTSADFAVGAGDLPIPTGTMWGLLKTSSANQFDPLIPAGWICNFRSS